MNKNAIILIPPSLQQDFCAKMKEIGLTTYDFHFVNDRTELDEVFNKVVKPDLVFSFGTSIIVPEKYLTLPGCPAINIHSASPAYPGRDPHHFAVYDSAKTYGATMHYMTKKVDDGPIIDVEFFDVTPSQTPRDLLIKANECSWVLMARLFTWLKDEKEFPLAVQYTWSKQKRSRKDFNALCQIDITIESEELNRRIRAFHVDNYYNLFVTIGGKKFYYKP